MRIDVGSFAFNCPWCPSWGTAIVNQDKGLVHLIKTDVATNIIIGMVHNQVDFRTHDFSVPIGKGSHTYYGDTGFEGATSEPILVSVFKNVYVNGKKVDHPYILSIIKDRAVDHAGRLQLKWIPKMQYGDISNITFEEAARVVLGLTPEEPWIIYDIEVVGQDRLEFSAMFGGTPTEIQEKIVTIGPTDKLPYQIKEDEKNSWPLQKIVYGAPGTGKSRGTDDLIKGYYPDKAEREANVFRTTFHPDSDYSTFVGCYKPTTKSARKSMILDYDTLVDKYKELLAVPTSNVNQASTLMGYKYHDSIVQMQDNGHSIQQLVTDAYKSNTTYDTVVRNGMACYEENYLLKQDSKQITYEFVPQAFTKAYCRAYELLEANRPVFLVIEEINRGNCAQIFGDIFQLLDRDEHGVSDYAVKPDSDLEQYLIEHVEGYNPEEGMRLPKNLYIWATMNTSDQSLFPIDSAFKRRWEWQYVPIKDEGKNHKVQVGNKQFDWWEFLDAVNTKIEKLTLSEDKKLGYWFCKATQKASEGDIKPTIITTTTFVSKVVFYLWNDIFKDFPQDVNSPFTIKRDENHREYLKFHSFFDTSGNECEDVVVDFVKGLGVEVKNITYHEEGDPAGAEPDLFTDRSNDKGVVEEEKLED